MAWWSWF